jgi:hypothetical protein
LAGYLVKPLLSLQGTEWRERGYGLWIAGILADVAASLFLILDVFWRRIADFKTDTILLCRRF